MATGEAGNLLPNQPKDASDLSVRYRFNLLCGSWPVSNSGCKYAFIAVGNITGVSIAKATIDSTLETMIHFMMDELMFHFGPTKTVFSKHLTFFTAKKLSAYMSNRHIHWKKVSEYEPIGNGHEKRMVGRLKRSVKKMGLDYGSYWDQSLHGALYVYGCIYVRTTVYLCELLNGVRYRVGVADDSILSRKRGR